MIKTKINDFFIRPSTWTHAHKITSTGHHYGFSARCDIQGRELQKSKRTCFFEVVVINSFENPSLWDKSGTSCLRLIETNVILSTVPEINIPINLNWNMRRHNDWLSCESTLSLYLTMKKWETDWTISGSSQSTSWTTLKELWSFSMSPHFDVQQSLLVYLVYYTAHVALILQTPECSAQLVKDIIISSTWLVYCC